MKTDWKALVRRHAAASGAADLSARTVDELAAHLEDIYLNALASGQSEAAAMERATSTLTEAPLAVLPGPAHEAAPPPAYAGGSGWTGIVGDMRVAVRQLRRAPSLAIIAIVTLGLGAGAATAIF